MTLYIILNFQLVTVPHQLKVIPLFMSTPREVTIKEFSISFTAIVLTLKITYMHSFLIDAAKF
ncbi:MAG TPA: hypothetical protein DCG18_00250 [Richelia sp.]|nr:hypothetical protein [Richelia sp.]